MTNPPSNTTISFESYYLFDI